MARESITRAGRPGDTGAALPVDQRRVWAVLVNEAGATDTDGNWVQFRQWLDKAIAEGRGEYRFMGSLGFGGKFWLRRDGMHVSCYPEDVTDTRADVIRLTNLALARLQEEST